MGFSTIRAIADGTVTQAGTPSGWSGGGVQVWIQHDGYLSRSMHMVKGSPVVSVGQRVAEGDPLGQMGMTGNVTGVHLHLEIASGGVQVDSEPFIAARLTPEPQPAPTPIPIPTVSEEDDMRLYRWNQKQVFGIEQGTVYYIATPAELETHSAQLGAPTDVDNAGLTAALVRNGVHWDAVEAVLRGVGQGPDGHLWNRLTAEGEAIRGSQLVQTRTLDDVLATLKTLDV